jgi:hypothetical protein
VDELHERGEVLERESFRVGLAASDRAAPLEHDF